MTLENLLGTYDDISKKRFYDSDVTSDLMQLPEEEKVKAAFKYEVLAFALVANGSETEWGTYYGPKFLGKKSDGTPASYPELNDIDNAAVLYWEDRAQHTNNPLMKARYCGLVWDFKKRVCGESYPSWLFESLITSLIAVANGDYEPHDVITVNVLERLASLAGKDPKYQEKIKAAFIRFDNEKTEESCFRCLRGSLKVGKRIEN